MNRANPKGHSWFCKDKLSGCMLGNHDLFNKLAVLRTGQIWRFRNCAIMKSRPLGLMTVISEPCKQSISIKSE